MIAVIYIGGPYHGIRGKGILSSDNVAVVHGARGDQRYVQLCLAGNILLYRHESIDVPNAWKLAASVK